MKTFKEFLKKDEEENKFLDCILALEHQVYKQIPGTKNSYREDSANTSSKTLKHAHVFAKSKGKGKQLYSVNIDGSGHDGSSGFILSKKHADFFKDKGYEIDDNLALESISENFNEYEFILLEDSE